MTRQTIAGLVALAIVSAAAPARAQMQHDMAGMDKDSLHGM